MLRTIKIQFPRSFFPGAHLSAAALAFLCCPSPAATAAGPNEKPSPLGIGFLWTANSERVVDRLTSEKDFVDVILGPGKLDVFQKVKPPARVLCIARSLEKNEARPFPGIKETIETLKKADIPKKRVVITYNPEGQPGTPKEEFRDLVASCRKAKELADEYGAPLMVGPGLRDMMTREDLYPELAKTCDMWMIQSQRLQLDEATRRPVAVASYREKVKRIVEKLREGNPGIQIFVQLVTTAERGSVTLSADQIAAFSRSIEDLVDAVRIYGAPPELLEGIFKELRGDRRGNASPGTSKETNPRPQTKAGNR